MATAVATYGPSIKMQIVVEKKRNRVVFAEANKDFVDFIFHILSLPLGTVQSILNTKSASFGSIGTLYDGLKKLDTEYMEVDAKDYLLYVKAPYSGANLNLLLPKASYSKPRPFYFCVQDRYVHVGEFQECRSSSRCLVEIKTVVGPVADLTVARGNDKGYVKEVAAFMVMDDLAVRPAEPASIISLMNQHSINDVRDIEKRVVTFGTSEAIKLLKASVSSKTALTDVFLRGAVKAEN